MIKVKLKSVTDVVSLAAECYNFPEAIIATCCSNTVDAKTPVDLMRLGLGNVIELEMVSDSASDVSDFEDYISNLFPYTE